MASIFEETRRESRASLASGWAVAVVLTWLLLQACCRPAHEAPCARRQATPSRPARPACRRPEPRAKNRAAAAAAEPRARNRPTVAAAEPRASGQSAARPRTGTSAPCTCDREPRLANLHLEVTDGDWGHASVMVVGGASCPLLSLEAELEYRDQRGALARKKAGLRPYGKGRCGRVELTGWDVRPDLERPSFRVVLRNLRFRDGHTIPGPIVLKWGRQS